MWPVHAAGPPERAQGHRATSLCRGRQPQSDVNAPAWRLACAAASARPACREFLRRRNSAPEMRQRRRTRRVLCAPRRALELEAVAAVWGRRGRGQMPRAADRVSLMVGRLLQCRGAPRGDQPPQTIHTRRNETAVAETHTLGGCERPVCLRRFCSRRPDPRRSAARHSRSGSPTGRPPRSTTGASFARAGSEVVQRSSPRSFPSPPLRSTAQTRPPAATPSTRVEARAAQAGCRASRR